MKGFSKSIELNIGDLYIVHYNESTWFFFILQNNGVNIYKEQMWTALKWGLGCSGRGIILAPEINSHLVLGTIGRGNVYTAKWQTVVRANEMQ